MPSVHTFFGLHEDFQEFIEYLSSGADVWARCVVSDPDAPALSPAPIAEFAKAFQQNSERSADIYIGRRHAVLNPPISIAERIEGGTHVPFVQFGEVVPGAFTIVGGTKVKIRVISGMSAELISYRQGTFIGSSADIRHSTLSLSNLFYYSTGVSGGDESGRRLTSVKKSEEFHTWARRIVAWVRRRTKATVPLETRPVTFPCTKRVADAHSAGLRLID